MLVERLRAEAAARQLGAGIVTFHPHPITVLRPDIEISYLTSLETRVEQLRTTGVDFVAVVQFTSELAQVSAEDFARILVEETGLKLIVIGRDFALGRNREGTPERLAELGLDLGFEVQPIELLPEDGGPVSSTRVREALAAGLMAEAEDLLGRPFALRGPIVTATSAAARSASLRSTSAQPRPRASRRRRLRLAHRGRRPQSRELHEHRRAPHLRRGAAFVETHLLDFEGDLYDRVASVELLHRLRPEQKFDGPEALIAPDPPRRRRDPGLVRMSATIEQQFAAIMRGAEFGDDATRRTMERELRERLAEGRPLRVYCGYDPTAVDLHLGHTLTMRKLRTFQDFGHEVTFLIGNFTSLVSDPSDKNKTRPMLSPEEIEANSRTYVDQVFRILDRERTIVRRNADWLGKLNFGEVLRLASHFTVAQFLERDNLAAPLRSATTRSTSASSSTR